MKKINNLKTKLSYACGDVYGGGAFFLVSLLYLNFLTDIVKISPALAGSIFLIGKIWDAVSDPIMGIISDRTKSKYGRRRVYFLIGIVPSFLSFLMLWQTIKTDNEIALYLYYLLSYLFFNTSLTLVYIPYSSILPAMTSDYKERSSFITIRLVFSNISALISGVLPMIIIGVFQRNVPLGYSFMGLVFALFFSLPYIPLFFGTYEKDQGHEFDNSKFSFKQFADELKTTFSNRSFRIYSGFFIAAQTAVDFVVTLFIYYLTYVIGKESLFSAVLGVLIIVQIISMPIHVRISHTRGKTAPFKIGLPVWVLALIISFFISTESSSAFIFIIAILTGFGCSASIFVPWSVFPELADIDEIITNRRREGIYSGISTLIRKVAQAGAIFLIGVSLEFIGYIPNIEQSSSTLLGIKLLFSIVPILFIAVALFYSSKYKLTEERYGIIKREIERRNSDNSAPIDEETIKVCEVLTGIHRKKLKLVSE